MNKLFTDSFELVLMDREKLFPEEPRDADEWPVCECIVAILILIGKEMCRYFYYLKPQPDDFNWL